MKSNIIPILIVFVVYGLVIITIASYAKRCTKDLADYILGGRSLSGVITALSVGASDMSSWLLMALPGIIYVSGFSMSWIAIGLLAGAFTNWLVIAKRLRIFTEIYNDSLTLPAYLCNRFDDKGRGLRLVISLAVIIFYIFYIVSGFVSGAILTNMTFGIDYKISLILSAGLVVLYTTIGGFLAISWIDFFQGGLMLLALLLVPIVGFVHFGGIEPVLTSIAKYKSDFLMLNNITFIGVLSLFFWGLGYLGQPHINLRFMAIRKVNELSVARRICISWMGIALFGAILTGLIGAVFFMHHPLQKSETVFIHLSYALFNPWVVGILLSAILSAVMSNVSAQLLMIASILVEDFYRVFFRSKASAKEYLWISRICLICIAFIAIFIAAQPEITIFRSVAFAWCGLGASFGPVLVFSLYWRRITKTGAIAGVFVGGLVVILWYNFVKISGAFPGLEVFPGFVASSAAIYFISMLSAKPNKKTLEKFDEAVKDIS